MLNASIVVLYAFAASQTRKILVYVIIVYDIKSVHFLYQMMNAGAAGGVYGF